MSLKVWLPLTGSLENKGVSNSIIAVNGATVNTSGIIGNCYSFDGSNDYISITDSNLYSIFKGGNQPFSIAMWVYHADSTRAILFGDYQLSGSISFNIELTTGHIVRFYWGASPDYSTGVSVDAAVWTHIIITYDGQSLRTYKNGVLSNTRVGTLDAKNKVSGDFYLGRDSRTGTTVLNGRLNDVRIYDHCISLAEIKDISKGLLCHYKLDSITDSVCIDSSGYGRNATIVGTASLVDSSRYYKGIYMNNTSTANRIYADSLPVSTQSISCWVKCSKSKNQVLFADKNTGMEFGIYNNLAAVQTSNKLLYNLTDFVTNAWNHVVVLKDSTNNKLYINGIAQTISTSSNWYTHNGDLYLLNRNANNNYAADASMSDFRAYATLLTEDDIKKLFEIEARVVSTEDIHTYELIEGEEESINTNGTIVGHKFFENPLTSCLHCDQTLYTEPDGSLWVRVFHHNNPANGLFTKESAWNEYVYVDENRWFDIHDTAEMLYSYEIMVKQKTTSSASEVKYRWIQSVNPFLATWSDVKPANVTRITTSGYTNGGNGGLYYSNGSAYMVIANANSGNWYGATGSWTAYQGGIPGYPNTTITSGYMDIYLRVYDCSKIISNKGFASNHFIEM